MALAIGHKDNLNTIIEAAKAGDLAVMECYDRVTREPVPVLIAIYLNQDGEFVMVPLAKMFTSSPYDELLSPMEHDDAQTV